MDLSWLIHCYFRAAIKISTDNWSLRQCSCSFQIFSNRSSCRISGRISWSIEVLKVRTRQHRALHIPTKNRRNGHLNSTHCSKMIHRVLILVTIFAIAGARNCPSNCGTEDGFLSSEWNITNFKDFQTAEAVMNSFAGKSPSHVEPLIWRVLLYSSKSTFADFNNKPLTEAKGRGQRIFLIWRRGSHFPSIPFGQLTINRQYCEYYPKLLSSQDSVTTFRLNSKHN